MNSKKIWAIITLIPLAIAGALIPYHLNPPIHSTTPHLISGLTLGALILYVRVRYWQNHEKWLKPFVFINIFLALGTITTWLTFWFIGIILGVFIMILFLLSKKPSHQVELTRLN